MEDNVYLSQRRGWPSTITSLWEKVQRLGPMSFKRPVANVAEARQILGFASQEIRCQTGGGLAPAVLHSPVPRDAAPRESLSSGPFGTGLPDRNCDDSRWTQELEHEEGLNQRSSAVLASGTQ